MKLKPRLSYQQKRLIVAALEFRAATADELGRWAKRSKGTIFKIVRDWNWR